MNEPKTNQSRRDFIKKAAYTAPVIMTMSVAPQVHAYGSVESGSRCKDRDRTYSYHNYNSRW
jgi:hypothetical protein